MDFWLANAADCYHVSKHSIKENVTGVAKLPMTEFRA